MMFVLAACDNTPKQSNETKQPQGTTSSVATTGGAKTTEIPEEKLEIPENVDFEEYEFNILGLSQGDYSHIDLVAEDIQEEPINDAVYERNNFVQDLLNIKINAKIDTKANVVSTARSNIGSGLDAYDLYLPTMSDAAPLAQSGLFEDLYTVPYLNVHKPWWDQSVIRDLDINGHLYFTTGEISILDDDLCFVLVFNKVAMQEKTDVDVYQIVRDKKWTLGALEQLIKDYNDDTNGDGKMDDKDQWGMMLNENNITIFYLSAGERMVGRDEENNSFKFAMTGSRASDVISKTLDFMLDNEFFMTGKGGWAGDANTQLAKFMDGSVLIRATVFKVVRNMRSMEFDFGVLPNPMFDDDQKEYFTPTSSQGYLPGLCVPTSAEDLERTGIITEALAYYSHVYLTPAFYDAALNGILLRDQESSEMLDIIFNTKVYDIGYIYNFADMAFSLRKLVQNGSKAFTSEMDKLTDPVNTAIGEMMDKFA